MSVRQGVPIVLVTLMAVDPAMGNTLATIETTEEHPFLVEATTNGDPAGWTRVDELSPGDTIKQFDGLSPGSVVVRIEYTSRREQVHNLEVEGLHTYLVGADGVVVHNGDTCSVIQRWLTESGGSVVRGKNLDDLEHLLDDLVATDGWKKEVAASGNGVRWFKDGKSIRFHHGGSRFDADHFYGKPYWVWSDGSSPVAVIKYEGR